jgi:hypothetical protein
VFIAREGRVAAGGNKGKTTEMHHDFRWRCLRIAGDFGGCLTGK